MFFHLKRNKVRKNFNFLKFFLQPIIKLPVLPGSGKNRIRIWQKVPDPTGSRSTTLAQNTLFGAGRSRCTTPKALPPPPVQCTPCHPRDYVHNNPRECIHAPTLIAYHIQRPRWQTGFSSSRCRSCPSDPSASRWHLWLPAEGGGQWCPGSCFSREGENPKWREAPKGQSCQLKPRHLEPDSHLEPACRAELPQQLKPEQFCVYQYFLLFQTTFSLVFFRLKTKFQTTFLLFSTD